jgi:hypothetical protein
MENIPKNTVWGSFITGILGALGGAENSSKMFRRFCLPLFLFGEAFHHFNTWHVWTILLMIPIFHIGYGIPDENDEGSPLGKFWMWVFRQNMLLANIFTRGTIGCLIAATLIPLAHYTNNHLIFVIGGYTIKVIYAGLSWKDLGYFEFQGKKLLWNEFLVYATVGLVSLLIIYL